MNPFRPNPVRKKRLPRKRDKPRRKRPELFHKPERDRRFLDVRSYVTKGGRVRLFGEDYELLRINAYHRAAGWCECGCGYPAFWHGWTLAERGEFAHNDHGSRKSDELSRGKWMRHECHEKSHNCGGKPCPKKAA